MRVGVVQFVKGKWQTGERAVLERFPDLVTVRTMGEGFTWETQDRARDIRAAQAAWAVSREMIAACRGPEPAYDMVILDELNIVLRYGYLPLDEVVAELSARPPMLHIVATGRNARAALVDAADLVTEMTMVKHPFRSGGQGAERHRILTAALMLQGTGSDVGKSLLAAGLCRAAARRGIRVRPFKPQNMSNNAAVTADGGEIGRAQALQARACGVAPTRDMNPVLLKPQSETGAQVVVCGAVRGNARARDYQAMKPRLLDAVLDSFARLCADAELVIVEGAGSPAEINLRAGDIANMGFARAAGVPVAIVGDIDRGGVIAQIVGVWTLLDAADRALLAGAVVNKFRGDIALFESGLAAIAERTGLDNFGVVPWFASASRLPAEDAMAVTNVAARPAARRRGHPHRCAAAARIANFDDLDPLRAEPDVALRMARAGEALPGDADLVLLCGSKSTLADLAALRANGWDIDILAHRRRGGAVLGLCGGYQMLGRAVRDDDGIEGAAGPRRRAGPAALRNPPRPHKVLRSARGAHRATGEAVRGYLMHMGETIGDAPPMLDLDGEPDGAGVARRAGARLLSARAVAADGFRHAFLDRLRRRAPSGVAYEAGVEDTLDGLADHLETHLAIDRMLEAAHARP